MPRKVVYSEAAQAALLNWVNTFPIDKKVQSLAELTDGHIFSKLLEDIEPSYAFHDLDEASTPSKWLKKKQTLSGIHKSLLRYINNHCLTLESEAFHLPPIDDTVDINAIAEDDDPQQTTKLLTIFLIAAVRGNNNEKFVERIQKDLDYNSQQQIKTLIEQMNVEEKDTYDTLEEPEFKNASASPKLTKDIQLAFEEEHASLFAEHEALKKKHADFITRFEHLQQSHDELLQHSNRTDRQLESLQSLNQGNQADDVNRLLKQIRENEDLIASQEQQVESDRVIKEKQQRELASLRPAAQRLIELEDQVKELKTENLSLSKKANTVEHFQRKLERQSAIEETNKRLRDQIETLENNQKDYDKVYEENARVKTTVEEYQTRFNSYERDFVEIASQKRLLEQDLRLKEEHIQGLNARQQHDERYIDQLQEQLRTNSTGPLSPDSPTPGQHGMSLGEELEQSETSPNYSLEISRLKAENQLLKSNTAGMSNANLQIELEESERKRKRLEENLRDLTEKHTIGQEQLNAIISDSSGEKLVKITDRLMAIGPLQILTENFYRNEAVAKTRKLYLEANHELTSAKSKLSELQAELSSRDRELLAAKSDLSAVDQEEIAALEDLKATNEIITSSFQNDLLILQSKHKNLITDFEQQKTQLIDVLLSKDKLIKDIAALREQVGATESDDYNKANSKAIIEREKAQKALEEVRREISGPKPTKKRNRLFKAVSNLSFNPYSSKHLSAGYKSSAKDENSRLDVELGHERDHNARDAMLALERERAAIGSLAPLPRLLISPGTIPPGTIPPGTIPLPPSPAKKEHKRPVNSPH